MDEIKIDVQGAIQQIKDQALLELLAALIPDKDTAKQAVAMLSVFVRYGISVDTAIKIALDLAEVLKQIESED